MYDCIVVESPLLPNGVNLPEVLEGAAESEVKEVLASMPEPGQRISAAALVAAGASLHIYVEQYLIVRTECLDLPQIPFYWCVQLLQCKAT